MQQAARLLAICVFGLGLAQIEPAQACFRYDRAAEMAVIKDAITSPATPADKKAALEAIHTELRAFQKKNVWEGSDNTRVGDLLRKGMALVGKERIAYHEPQEKKPKRKTAKAVEDAPVTFSAAVPKSAPIRQAAVEEPLRPSCG